MSAVRRILSTTLKKPFCSQTGIWRGCVTQAHTVINTSNEDEGKTHGNSGSPRNLSEYRFIYPEFLPIPKYEFRHKVKEKLEREDMLRRRDTVDIPEFYVGSILAVVASDPYAPNKQNRFVGICIARTYNGLRATFSLRNIVDGQGIEMLYDLYNPTILSIDVLRLEKRLDDHLFYLRDAPPEYSTVPFDMEPEFIVEGEPVRVNPIKVKLKPPPWTTKWEQRGLKGVDESFLSEVPKKRMLRLPKVLQPWEDYDIMKQYRRCVPEEDQEEIWSDVKAMETQRPAKQQLYKRTLQKAKPKKRG